MFIRAPLTVAQKALDALLPPLCLLCHERTGAHQALCAACWKDMHFIDAPMCARCGLPFDVPMGDDALCASCLDKPPLFAQARSALLYDDRSKRLVLGFKHGDRLHHVPAMAAWMRRAGAGVLKGADVLVPVPLHWLRLFRRRYNQAALLAQGVAKTGGLPVAVDVLRRVRATPSQGGLKKRERLENVEGAFVVNPKRRASVEGKTVVLIDDVLTTGATVNACCATLLESGAREARVLTLMRARAFRD